MTGYRTKEQGRALSPADEALIAQLKKQWEQANAAGDQALMDELHSTAEAIRAGYGFSGGDDGTERIALKEKTQAGGEAAIMPVYTPPASTMGSGNPGERDEYQSKGTHNDATLSESDREYIAQLKKQWEQANAAGDQALMDELHARAEAVRSGYGYSGGEDGSEYLPLEGSRKEEAQAPAVRDYSRYIEEMERAAQEKALAELKGAYEKNLAALQRTGAEIRPYYQQARNQTAAQGELAQRQFAEYAAANGLNSGTGGQARLAQGAALQQGLSQIGAAEASALGELAMQRSQMESEYNAAIAKARASGDYELARELYEEKVRQDKEALEQLQWQAQQRLSREKLQDQRDQWEQQFQSTEDQKDWERMLEIARMLASYGDFSGYEALGYDTSGMRAVWEEDRRRKAASGK